MTERPAHVAELDAGGPELRRESVAQILDVAVLWRTIAAAWVANREPRRPRLS